MLTDYSTETGFFVRTAADGHEGLTVLRQWRPDLIVLDLEMPGLDGPEFRGAQLRLESAATIPVLLYSAPQDLVTRAEALQAAGVMRKRSAPHEVVPAVQSVDFPARAGLPVA